MPGAFWRKVREYKTTRILEGIKISSGSYKQVYVRCPFYKWDDGQHRITCEGIVEDSSLASIFKRKEDYTAQMTVFCCKYYKNCEVYQMLMEKYEGE